MVGPSSELLLRDAPERELVARAQRGERAALDALMARFAQPLFAGFVLPRVGHRADAEDLVREAIARAVERLPSFAYREESGFYPWLRTIAERLVIDRARRLEARGRGTERYGAEVRTLAPVAVRSIESEAIEAEEKAIAKARLDRALSEILPRYRRVIELRVLEEKSREVCASELGVTVGNLDVLVHRALAALKARMTAVPDG
ncbi:MAG: RNA polymerase sigma factor [Sandaracinaceae bacterium]|jgi:RNA polymerase sigma-70 factor (ECF subfamily)|nr:RNA polymerase sigma factor [Sandaracinaceae bacterium]